jgi:hypothetical protein
VGKDPGDEELRKKVKEVWKLEEEVRLVGLNFLDLLLHSDHS